MKRLKYNNAKVVTDEGVFDSKKEYSRWMELCEMEKKGEITQLRKQVKYVLIPKQVETYTKQGKRKLLTKTRVVEKEVSYLADFEYADCMGRIIVEDVKSSITRKNPLYKVKRKLMLWVHDIKIQEI